MLTFPGGKIRIRVLIGKLSIIKEITEIIMWTFIDTSIDYDW